MKCLACGYEDSFNIYLDKRVVVDCEKGKPTAAEIDEETLAEVYPAFCRRCGSEEVGFEEKDYEAFWTLYEESSNREITNLRSELSLALEIMTDRQVDEFMRKLKKS